MATAVFRPMRLFQPLKVTAELVPVTEVPTIQTVDSAAGVYAPDYTIVPVSLRPNISVVDERGGQTNNDAVTDASVLSSMKYEIIDSKGNVTTCEAGVKTDYDAITSGADAGLFNYKKNVPPNETVTVRFTATYVDKQSKHSYPVVATAKITCLSETATSALIVTDAPSSLRYNPLRDGAEMGIGASLWLSGTELSAANGECGFVWERLDGQNWVEIDPDANLMDYDFKVSADKTTLTLYRDLMGTEAIFRVRAWYMASGVKVGAGVAGSDALAPEYVFTVTRRIPDLKLSIEKIPETISVETKTIYPEVEVSDYAIIPDPEKELNFNWRVATGNVQGTVKLGAVIAQGKSVAIPTDTIDLAYGGTISVDYEDRGCYKALQLADGSLLATADGKLLVAKTK